MITLEIENKEYFIPESPAELSLVKFERIQNIIKEDATISGVTQPFTYKNIVDIVAVTIDIDKDIFMDAPIEFTNFIVDKLQWLFELDIDKYPLLDYVMIDGQKYCYDKAKTISNREWIDIDTIISKYPKEDRTAGVLCVRLRKELIKRKEYDPVKSPTLKDNQKIITITDEKTGEEKHYIEETYLEKYKTKFIKDRIEKFKNAPVEAVMPILNFFSFKDRKLADLLKCYSKGVELALHNQHHLNELVKSGDGSTRWLNLHKKIYSKSITSLNLMLSQLLTSYPTQ